MEDDEVVLMVVKGAPSWVLWAGWAVFTGLLASVYMTGAALVLPAILYVLGVSCLQLGFFLYNQLAEATTLLSIMNLAYQLRTEEKGTILSSDGLSSNEVESDG